MSPRCDGSDIMLVLVDVDEMPRRLYCSTCGAFVKVGKPLRIRHGSDTFLLRVVQHDRAKPKDAP